ncbi:MAG: F0F1 ATP synthase subunit A [Gammaproteobacteria bacterium WSBS_2016_MAG_OTU1]
MPWPENLGDYIRGHLNNYTVGDVGEGAVTWALNLDTMVMSWLMAILMLWGFTSAAKKARVKEPSKWQVFCEMLFAFFDKQVRDMIPHAPPLVGPLAVTLFVWIFLINCLDIVPVDLIATTGYLLTDSVPHFKILPTADLSLTAGLALSVFFLTMYYNIKNKGLGGFLHEVAAAPFGIKMAPANILLRIVEEVARPLSLAMRLFGNLFAAEVIFLLIGGGISYIATGSFLGQFVLGAPWAIYHILVIPLQAYIFSVLTVVYISMAHEQH